MHLTGGVEAIADVPVYHEPGVHAYIAVIVKFKRHLVPEHFREAHGVGGEVEVWLHSFATSALDGHESLDPHSARFILRERILGVF